MELLTTRAEVGDWSDRQRAAGLKVGFVPTMGALHEGHLTLVRQALQRCDRVVASIFVNPTQFGPNEDFNRYPRPLAEDQALLAAVGCQALWLPGVEDIYPAGCQTVVRVEGLGAILEGEHRPTHFQGVATVVTILCHLVRPHELLLGLKDYQQYTLLRQMVRDLGLNLAVVGVETVREADGLAMSSRNRYLNAEERQQAAAIFQALQRAKAARQVGERDLEQAAREVLLAAGITRIDYVEVREADTLQAWAPESGRDPILLIAARVGNTRLIDNLLLTRAPE